MVEASVPSASASAPGSGASPTPTPAFGHATQPAAPDPSPATPNAILAQLPPHVQQELAGMTKERLQYIVSVRVL